MLKRNKAKKNNKSELKKMYRMRNVSKAFLRTFSFGNLFFGDLICLLKKIKSKTKNNLQFFSKNGTITKKIITRPNCALDRHTILFMYVPGFRRQVSKHEKFCRAIKGSQRTKEEQRERPTWVDVHKRKMLIIRFHIWQLWKKCLSYNFHKNLKTVLNVFREKFMFYFHLLNLSAQ